MKKPTKAQLKKWASDQGFKEGDLVMFSRDGIDWRCLRFDEPNYLYFTYARPLTASERDDMIKRIRWEGEL